MYCIMRTEKRKKSDIGGIQQENNRTATEYNNKVELGLDILNKQLIYSNNWLHDIQQTIDKAGARTRANSVIALDTIYTASPQFFQNQTNEQNDQYFKDCLQFHQQKFGHIISAIIHYDESTPHMHVISVPLTKDNRLSARDIIGNKQQMSRAQDEFFEKVGNQHGLERGMMLDGQAKKKHISAQEWELRQVQQEKSKELQELNAIKNSKTHARERATRAREQAQEQQKANSELRAIESQIRANMEQEKVISQQLRELNERARQELRATKKQLERLAPYLTKAEQRKLQEFCRYRDEDFNLE